MRSRAFSPSEALKIEIDLDSEVVRSKKQRALAGLLVGLDAQLVPALSGGVRLGGQQRRVQVGGSPAPAGAQPKGAVGGLGLAEQ